MAEDVVIAEVRKKEWTETPEAMRAFDDYLAHVDGGGKPSVKELWQKYTLIHRDPDQPDPPTTSYDTLKQWSARFEWEKRRLASAAEANASVLRQRQSTIDSEKAQDLQRIDEALKTAKPSEIVSLIELRYRLLGEPLPKQVQVSGPGGGPLVQVDIMFPHLSVAQLAELAQREALYAHADQQRALPEATDGNGRDDEASVDGAERDGGQDGDA